MSFLSEDDLASFSDLGYTVVRGAFARETADACVELIWQEMERDHGHKRLDVATWPEVKCPMALSFRQKHGSPWSEVFTPRLLGAIADICGGEEGTEPFGCGWWMCTFPPLERRAADYVNGNGDDDCEWQVEGAWHVDGHWFDHYPFSSEVGLVAVMLFTDIARNGGGTAVAERSHIDVLQTLCGFGLDGCRNTALARATLAAGRGPYDVVELTGSAGDVVLMHPLLLHARSSNLSCRPPACRIIAHPSIPLRQPLDLLASPPSNMLAAIAQSAILGLGEEQGPAMLRLLTSDNVKRHQQEREREIVASEPSKQGEEKDIEGGGGGGGSELYDAMKERRPTGAAEGVEEAAAESGDDIEETLGFRAFKFFRH